MISDVLRCFQMFSGCSQLLRDVLSADVFKICSNDLRCSKVFSDVHRCSWMFSRCSLEVFRMLTGFVHDVLKIFSGCSHDLYMIFSGCFQDVLTIS